MSTPESPRFPNVTAVAKANVYFDGKVLSHTILAADGAKTTLGIIFPGQYHFGTQAAELMDIVAGRCVVTLDGETEARSYGVGDRFKIPGDAGFTIEVSDGLCEYVCAFLA